MSNGGGMAAFAAVGALAVTAVLTVRSKHGARRRKSRGGACNGQGQCVGGSGDGETAVVSRPHALFPGLARCPILGVGLACIDVVAVVPQAPEEDGESRAIAMRRSRGGNATNLLNVCGQLGAPVAWIGTTAEDGGDDARFVLSTLKADGIDSSRRVQCPNATIPVSWITLSKATGSRTIVHYRKLPELSCTAFFSSFSGGSAKTQALINALSAWRCIFFEGRNVAETGTILRFLRQARSLMLPASLIGSGVVTWRNLREHNLPLFAVEIEKSHPGIAETLVPLADVVLVSREYAHARGFASAESVLEDLAIIAAPGAVLSCAWGAAGATGVDLAESEAQQQAVQALRTRGRLNPASMSMSMSMSMSLSSLPSSGGDEDGGGGDGIGVGTNTRLRWFASDAFTPEHGVVDTVGAGDTFNATFICGLLDGLEPEGALMVACAVAGTKVGLHGMHGIVNARKDALQRLVSKARAL